MAMEFGVYTGAVMPRKNVAKAGSAEPETIGQHSPD